jgi:undecaprenyl-diphosphatase
MELMQAAVLGIVQGLTEFLPISSSAHLIIVPWFAGWKDPGPTFDVALHLGTLLALIIYFWPDWIAMLRTWRKPLLWLIVLGCIPAAIFGFKYEKYFDTVFRSPLIIGVFMMAMGIVMGLAERFSRKSDELGSLNWKKSLFIGCAQVLALMPGVSRSGITITAGLAAGLKRESAARFSFLLAMPITAGAVLLKLMHIIHYGIAQNEQSSFVVGIVLSAIVGYLAIRYLLQYLQQHSLNIFVWYRLVLGAVVLSFYFLK